MAQPDSPILQAALAGPGWIEALNEQADALANALHGQAQSLQNNSADLEKLLAEVAAELEDLEAECTAAQEELQARFAEVREELVKAHAEIQAAEDTADHATAELTEALAAVDQQLKTTMQNFTEADNKLRASYKEMSNTLAAAHVKLSVQTHELPIHITTLTAAIGAATVQADEAVAAFNDGVETLEHLADSAVEKANATEAESAAEFEHKIVEIDTENFRASINMAEHVGEVLEQDVVTPFRTQAESYGAQYLQLATELRAEIDAIGEASDDVTPMQEEARDLTDIVLDALPVAKEVFEKLDVDWPGK